jgi:hypothetical protein
VLKYILLSQVRHESVRLMGPSRLVEGLLWLNPVARASFAPVDSGGRQRVRPGNGS